ncbi:MULTISPECIES: oxidative stress defense protein [Tatumella]|uniref:Oxidative stress defense protein n=1 Tax=Tatumella punctata TaxID=399969 RepID=A0ABW1VTM5_9GAMM|nr:oxidative stress defense protein [Tatumella sp. JGM130]
MKLQSLVIPAIFAAGVSSLPVIAAESPDSPHIAVTGQALVKVKPDMATLSIDVRVTDKQAAQAKKQADQRVALYFDFLKKNGIDSKDIDAANISTRAQYDYSKQGTAQLTGYQAERQVSVTVRHIDRLNTLLEGALNSGLDEIRAVTPAVSDAARYQQQARDEAIKDAISQAQAVAKGFNAQLGPVWSIRYHAQQPQPQPVMRFYGLAKASAETSPEETYQQQSVSFDDQLSVVFELKPQQPAVP